MKKVIIINSDRNAIFTRTYRISETLIRNGYDVEILTWDRTGRKIENEYIYGCKVHNFRFRLLNINQHFFILFYPIWWVYVFFYLLLNESDLYHPLNLYNLIPVVPIKIIKKKKIIYDLTDAISESIKWPTVIRSFLLHMENFFLNFVSAIIIVDEHRIRQIKTIKDKKIAIVMNSPEDLIKNIKIEKNQNKNQFIIFYGGWIAETRGIKQICEAVIGLNNVKLIIAGFGPYEKKLSPFLKFRNIEFKGMINKIDSLEWTKKADVIFAFYDPKIPINRLASPNKVFDAIMCGTPILGNSEALPVAEIINKEKCGLLVSYGDVEGIKNAIKWLIDNPKTRIEMGLNGRNIFINKYNWNIMEDRLIHLYNNIKVGK